MDSKSILKACKSILLKPYFKGILFCNRSTRIQIKHHNIGDFYIVNTDGNHGGEYWFCIIREYNMCVLYDCTTMTPEYKYESIISRLKMACIIDRKDIEGLNSLLCGEFSIAAAIQMSKILIKYEDNLNSKNHPKNFYFDNLLKYVATLKISADAYVLDYVYHKLKQSLNIQPAKRKNVLSRLNHVYTR